MMNLVNHKTGQDETLKEKPKGAALPP